MSRALNRVQGKNFKASKFRQVVSTALSRISKLKEERHDKCSAHLKAIHLFLPFGSGLLNPALRRCGDLIKDQNRLDAYVMIERYLILLMERINLLGHGRDCPAELKEAASGVVFAATRCKEIPELEEIKSILTSSFGKGFIGRAVELRNSSGANKLIEQKLSTMKPSPESKMNLLKAIASQKGEPSLPNQEQRSGNKRKSSTKPRGEMRENLSGSFESEDPSSSTHCRKKNKDVTSNTNPYQTDSKPSSFIRTRQKNKSVVVSTTNPNQISFKPSSSMQTRQKNKGVALNSSPSRIGLNQSYLTQTRQKNKGVALNTSPNRTNFDPSSSMETRQKNEVVALNSNLSGTSFDSSSSAQSRQKNKGVALSRSPYRTRSSSHKRYTDAVVELFPSKWLDLEDSID